MDVDPIIFFLVNLSVLQNVLFIKFVMVQMSSDCVGGLQLAKL